MNISDIILLIIAILSGSTALTLLVGGVITFQKKQFQYDRKIRIAEIADDFMFGGVFTIFYNVVANWRKNKEGRFYVYGCVVFAVTTIFLAHFINIK